MRARCRYENALCTYRGNVANWVFWQLDTKKEECKAKLRCVMREKQIELNLKSAVKARGGLALKFVSPGVVGVPDRMVLTPGGRVYFVELKAPGKNLSPRQVKMAAVLGRLGHKVWVIDSVEKVKGFVDEVCAS